MMAVVAMAPLSTAIFGMLNLTLGIVMFPISLGICIWLGSQFFRNM